MFWKQKKEQENKRDKIIIGMVMLNDENSFDLESLIEDYNTYYNVLIADVAGDKTSFAFTIEGESVLIAHMTFQIPTSDIEGTAKYAYNWQTALEDIKGHKSHLIVSIINCEQREIKAYKIFTRVICSLLRTTNSIGVYKGTQSLLIPKDDYLNEANFMSYEFLPLNLWIYFGLRVINSSNSGYTYGLKEFNKTEMEIVDSTKSMVEIREFLFNMSHYVLENDVVFKDGQTCGTTPDEKVAIVLSKGRFSGGETFKLSY